MTKEVVDCLQMNILVSNKELVLYLSHEHFFQIQSDQLFLRVRDSICVQKIDGQGQKLLMGLLH